MKQFKISHIDKQIANRNIKKLKEILIFIDEISLLSSDFIRGENNV